MKNVFKFGLLSLTGLLATGCIDNNYDLSDIDKTTQINVNDLTLPLNLDAIKLNDIIDTDGSEIKIININGTDVYAISQTGEFNSDAIEIDGFVIDPLNIPQIRSKFTLLNNQSTTRATDVPSEISSKYKLESSETQNIGLISSTIDETIISLDNAGCKETSVKIKLKAEGLASTTTLKINNIDINFIKGLNVKTLPSNYTYDPNSGILSVRNLECPNQEALISIPVIGFDFAKMGAKFEERHLSANLEVSLKEAQIETITKLDAGGSVSPEIVFAIDTEINELEINSFSGVVKYVVEGNGLKIDPVDLNDLPDFLGDSETDIKLSNPQLYLSISNPVATNNLKFQSGLEITSVHGDTEINYPLDAGEMIKVGTDKGVGPYNFVISPSMPSHPLESYKSGIQHVGYKNLSNVLSGNGLPSQIKINLINPEIPQQKVENFALGTTLSPISGTYDFIAPLALESGSKIVYSTTESGWGGDDLSKLTIKEFSLSADATNETPLNATLTVVPLSKVNFDDESEEAKPIQGVKGEVSLSGNSKDQPLSVKISGEIKNLDGVKIVAVVYPESSEAMAPEQTIILKNIKVTVSGYYITDFENE